jgi:hypothetical protein
VPSNALVSVARWRDEVFGGLKPAEDLPSKPDHLARHKRSKRVFFSVVGLSFVAVALTVAYFPRIKATAATVPARLPVSVSGLQAFLGLSY